MRMLFLQQDTSALEGLQSLYEPEAVRFSFDATGWKIVFGCLLLLFVVFLIRITRKYIRNKYRREAIASLQKSPATDTALILLKQLAMRVYGREQVGKLSGDNWLAFLDKTGKNVHFSELSGELQTYVFRGTKLSPDTERRLITNSIAWIKTHA